MKKVNAFVGAVVLVSAFLFGQACFGQADFTGPLPVNPSVKIGQLPNGLKYYILKNALPASKVQLRLVVNAGSVLEDNDQQGLAHMMEHMNFNGSVHFKRNELVDYLQSIGVKFGADLNAYTTFDETVFILPIPSDDTAKLEKGFTILEDWAGNATLDTAAINKERGIVLEESRLGQGANGRLSDQYFPELYHGSAYAHRLPIGKDSIIKNFDPSALTRFYKTWYRPDLEAVVIVGDIDPAAAEREIIRHFSHFTNPSPEVPRPQIIPIPEREQNTGMVLTDKEQTMKILQVFNYVEKATPTRTWNDFRQTIVEGLFNEMINARLSELSQLPEPPFLFGSTRFSEFSRGYRSFFSFAVIGDKPAKPAIDSLLALNAGVQKFGFLATELERAKSTLLNQLQTAYDNRDKTLSDYLVQGYINNFLEGTPIVGISNRYAFTKKVLPTISLAEVNALTKKMEARQGKFVLLLSPAKDSAELPTNSELLADVAAGEKLPPKQYTETVTAKTLMNELPHTGKIIAETKNDTLGTTDLTLSNGITITLKPTEFKNDDIQMDSWRWGGSVNFGLADKANAENAANLVMTMGVKDLSPTDLRKFLAGKTVTAQPYISPYDEGIQASSSVKDFETMLQLVHLYFTAPRKDAPLFQSYIHNQASFFQNLRSNPNTYFSDSVAHLEFHNDPWAAYLPDSATYSKISLDRSFAIYKEVYSNAYGLHFTFVGNIDIKKIEPLLALYLGSLPAKEKENKFTDQGLRPVKGIQQILINKGTAKQSMIELIFNGEALYSPEEVLKLQVLTDALNIRVTEELRESMSGMYTGGIFGTLLNRPYNHYEITAVIPCGPENVDKLTAALMGIIRNAIDSGVPQKDLDKVKANLQKQDDEQMKQNEHWLDGLTYAWIERYNPRWIDDYSKKLAALTVEDVKEAAKKYFQMDRYIKAVLNPEK